MNWYFYNVDSLKYGFIIDDTIFFMFVLTVTPYIVGAREENVTVVVNNFISLSCEATGLPPPTLSWFRDRRPVQASTNTLIMPGTHSYLHCKRTS